ncbi:MAG: hypothetical protein ACJ72N_06970 [Labedaea sp.]
MTARCELTELLIDQCGCRQHRDGHTPEEEAERWYDEPGPWFEASYHGTCTSCQEPFRPGHRIRSDGGHGWECCS